MSFLTKLMAKRFLQKVGKELGHQRQLSLPVVKVDRRNVMIRLDKDRVEDLERAVDSERAERAEQAEQAEDLEMIPMIVKILSGRKSSCRN
jgi:hypothetical protein